MVVDPVAEAVTHLVVGPEHPHGLGRLVPVGLIGATAGEIRLRCTLAEFARLSWAKETHFLPKSGVYPGYAAGQVFSWPYYGVGARVAPFHMGNLQQIVTYDSVALGEVEIRRGDRVHATDGDIGLVQGLVINGLRREKSGIAARKNRWEVRHDPYRDLVIKDLGGLHVTGAVQLSALPRESAWRGRIPA